MSIMAENIKKMITEAKSEEARELLNQAHVIKMIGEMERKANPVHSIIINLHHIIEVAKSLDKLDEEAHQILVDYIIDEIMRLKG